MPSGRHSHKRHRDPQFHKSGRPRLTDQNLRAVTGETTSAANNAPSAPSRDSLGYSNFEPASGTSAAAPANSNVDAHQHPRSTYHEQYSEYNHPPPPQQPLHQPHYHQQAQPAPGPVYPQQQGQGPAYLQPYAPVYHVGAGATVEGTWEE